MHLSGDLASKGFVGRKREMAALRTALDEATAGRGRLLLLAGEPGMGKTRTAEEFANVVRAQRGRVLWGRCYEGEGAPAFWPWVQVLHACAKYFDAEALRGALGAGAADLAHLVPTIREQLADVPEVTPSESPEARFRLFDGVARFLCKAAQQAPLAVILDDLHGADRSSLSLLEFLTREMRVLPILVLGTYRDVGATDELTEALVDLGRGSGTERLVLRGLSREEIAQFVEVSAGVKPPETLLTSLHQRTEGNPLFVGEFVRVLLAQHDDSAIRDPQPAFALAVPRGVKAVIERRLAPLTAACREVLRVAAVVGREFGLQIVAAVMLLTGAGAEGVRADEVPLSDVVREAEEAGLVDQLPESQRGYRFAHALIRETLYDGLRRSELATLHCHVGTAMERLPNADEHLSELAYHFFQAGADGANKTIGYAQRAGDGAMALLAYEEAQRLYDLGLNA
ncbi:MAG TPA: AAA family ATPase, partial [Candidatus Acidoferrales bacterium]|nr:AAA family ATPase [Candidatus Acidoferrales bacterium]